MALVNDLAGNTDAALFDWRMDTLIKHTLAHFESEEHLMRDANYPDLGAHAERHRALIAQIRIVRTSLVERLVAWSPQMAQLVGHWLVTHIGSADRLFAQYLRTAP